MNFKYIFRIIVLITLPHFLYILDSKLFDLVNSRNEYIPYELTNASLIILFTIIFFVNEIVLCKTTKQYFTSKLYFIPLLSLIIMPILGFVTKDFFLRENYDPLAPIILFVYNVLATFGITMLLVIRIALQNIFLNFFQQLPFFVLEKYFSKIVYTMFFVAIIGYVVSIVFYNLN